MNATPVTVLIVDDSAVARMSLTDLLDSDPAIRVIAAVDSGLAALEAMQNGKPDVIVMDLHMPRLDGFETTRRIMETTPVPIIICTATANRDDISTTFRAMEAGAVACVEKPLARERPDFKQISAHLVQTVKLMSEVKVVRRWPRSAASRNTRVLPAPARESGSRSIRVVGIGASTGGPPVLQTILGALPKDFPVPILIVQHISRGFLPGMADWLNQTTGLQVHVASHGAMALPGHAYLAPDDFQMGYSASGHIVLSREPADNGLLPSVSYLFRSLAEVCPANTIAILLSGMGKDGAAELKLLKDREAATIAQDRETSVVHGMPGEAIELGAANHILPADQIADTLMALMQRRKDSYPAI